MRFKLANGGVIASTKQPIQWRDFDRIEVSDNYAKYLATHGTFEKVGHPPVDGEISITVNFYNPSTHTIRKSYGNRCYCLSIGMYRYGHFGSMRLTDTQVDTAIALQNINYGSVINRVAYLSSPYFNSNYTWLINPFNQNWYTTKNKEWLPDWNSREPAYKRYQPNTFTCIYNVNFLEANYGGPQPLSNGHDGLRHIKKRIQHNITYVIRR